MAPRRGVGRPRDPRIDSAVRTAAVTLYAQEGWSGFNFDAVSRRSGVGKNAIYRRWRTREDLLVDAIRDLDVNAQISDAATLREACRTIARVQMSWWAGRGAAYLRLQMDQATYPFLGAVYQARVGAPLVEAFRGKLREAAGAGEVAPGASASLIVEALCGAVTMRMSAIADAERRALLDRPDAYLDRLVELVLEGVGGGSGR